MPCHAYALLCNASPCYAMLCHAAPRCAMLCHPEACYAMPCHAKPCCAMLCCAMLCHATSCCAMLCHATPSHAALCYATLRYAPCHVMSCCAVLYHAACQDCVCYFAADCENPRSPRETRPIMTGCLVCMDACSELNHIVLAGGSSGTRLCPHSRHQCLLNRDE